MYKHVQYFKTLFYTNVNILHPYKYLKEKSFFSLFIHVSDGHLILTQDYFVTSLHLTIPQNIVKVSETVSLHVHPPIQIYPPIHPPKQPPNHPCIHQSNLPWIYLSLNISKLTDQLLNFIPPATNQSWTNNSSIDQRLTDWSTNQSISIKNILSIFISFRIICYLFIKQFLHVMEVSSLTQLEWMLLSVTLHKFFPFKVSDNEMHV